MEPRSTGVADVGLSWLVGMRWGAFVSAIAYWGSLTLF